MPVFITMPDQRKLPLHEEMEARLPPELVGKIMREVKLGLKGRFQRGGVTTTLKSVRHQHWDTLYNKMYISNNSKKFPLKLMTMFYFLKEHSRPCHTKRNGMRVF